MTLKSNAGSCLFCKKEVFEITGQFQNLQPFGINEEDPIIQNGIIGKCHSSCLEKSKWGKNWFEILKKQLVEVQKYEHLQYIDTHFFYRNSYDDLYILSNKGSFFTLTMKDLEKVLKKDNKAIIKKKMVFSLDFNSNDFKSFITSKLEEEKSVSLNAITDPLQNTNTFHSNSPLELMTLNYNKVLARQCFGNWISAELEYEIHIDFEGFQKLKNFSEK